jgi:hypothetical protein
MPLRDRSHISLIFPYQSRPAMLGVDKGQLGLAIPATPTPTPHFHYIYNPIFTISEEGMLGQNPNRKIPKNLRQNYRQINLRNNDRKNRLRIWLFFFRLSNQKNVSFLLFRIIFSFHHNQSCDIQQPRD